MQVELDNIELALIGGSIALLIENLKKQKLGVSFDTPGLDYILSKLEDLGKKIDNA